MKSLVFDTETTGLVENSGRRLDKQPHIIEFSAQMIEDDGTVLEELDFLCNPGVQLDPIITKITGLKDSDLVGLKPFSNFTGKVQNIIEKADAVVAHNLSYDMGLVGFEFERGASILTWPERKICTVEQTEYFKGFRLSLQALHEHLFGIGFENAHRAKNDVAALSKCYVELLRQGII